MDDSIRALGIYFRIRRSGGPSAGIKRNPFWAVPEK
jgi:hypothetical protein